MKPFFVVDPPLDFSKLAFAGFLIRAPGISESMRDAMAGSFSGLATSVAELFHVHATVAAARVMDLMNSANEVVQRFGFTIALPQLQAELRAISPEAQVETLSEYEKLMLRLLVVCKQSTEVSNGLFNFGE